MIRQSIFLLLFTLLFTACVERGQTLKPTVNRSMSKAIAPLVLHHSNPKASTMQNKAPKENKLSVISKIEKVPVTTQNTSTTSEEIDEITHQEDSFFTLSDETKNKISGFFVIVIGIMILI